MSVLLDRAFRHVIRHGAMTVTGPDGATRHYGDGSGSGLHIQIKDSSWARRIALDGDLRLGEAYMEGGLVLLSGSIRDLLELLLKNLESQTYPPFMRFLFRLRIALKRIHQYNPIGRAKENVAHHYDINGAIYDLFLDRDRQYSCAYFENPKATLEDAQLAKKRHLAAKLDIRPGMRVLDIGSGWGGLGLYLAETCGAVVTGVTLSEEQHKLSRERAEQRGIASQVDFRLRDYRQLNEQYDRIVSVGMFEHVGVGHYKEFFRKVSSLLKDDGIAVLHSINRSDGPGATSAWIKKYIFPGGYIPALSEVLPVIERSRLYVTDIEILRLHYAQTLQEWYNRFEASRERAKAIYDERFCRMWEYYLAGSEMTFRYSGMNNFQIQMVKNQNALPLTRDYIGEAEKSLRGAETKQPRLKSVR
jgi:cyclopropane-fatty-acyl-phospholipid synthase